MLDLVVVDAMLPGEQSLVSALVARVFREFVAPHYSDQGVAEFLGYIQPEELSRRVSADHALLLARLGGKLAGMLEIRGKSHISLLFVDSPFQRRGIGKRLVGKAVEIIREKNPARDPVTVNAVPNSVDAYVKMGFAPTGPEEVKNGIRYIPMALRDSLLDS